MEIVKNISNLVKEQFPDFYKQEGPEFIAFLQAYYEWAEQSGKHLYIGRRLIEYNDIDETEQQFIKYFQQKYMKDIPDNTKGDIRFLQKHIVDLYRAKGSNEAIKLLFRILYNENIDIYVPAQDILKPSDNTWVEKKYIECSYVSRIREYQDKIITGVESRATALVDSYEMTNINNAQVHLLYLSLINGNFIPGEKLLINGLTLPECSYCRGSVVTATPVSLNTDFNVGDILIDIDNVNGKGLKVAVASTKTSLGVIDFDLIKGGDGYTQFAEITITAGANTSGSGASFVIGNISTEGYIYDYAFDELSLYTSTSLNAASYGFTLLPSANLSSLLYDALEQEDVAYGSIQSIFTTSPGSNYDGNVSITVIDPIMSKSGLYNANSEQFGNNAVVKGDAVIGSGVPTSFRIIESGKNYINGETIRLYDSANTLKTIDATITIGAIGQEEGYWENSKSFLSYDKFLQDNYYYQEYSYEIRSSRGLQKYFSILKDLAHPAGNKVFGRVSFAFELPTTLETTLTIE